MAYHVGSVDKSALGTPDADGLADSQRSHVLGDVSGRVGLDEKVDITRLVVTRDRGIRSNDLLRFAIGLLEMSTNGDVLTDWET